MEGLGEWIQRLTRFEPVLAAMVLLGIVVAGLFWLRRQREEEEMERAGAQSLRESLEAAYRAGEIDEREYQRVRDRLSETSRKGKGREKAPEKPRGDAGLELRAQPEGTSEGGESEGVDQ
jgi:Flp pilus assembly protein TadB